MIISGDELKEKGFGGIYNVGKAAEFPPALAVLSHTPEGATQNIAWVGKGIVYDTGGLSMKTKVYPIRSNVLDLCFARNDIAKKMYRNFKIIFEQREKKSINLYILKQRYISSSSEKAIVEKGIWDKWKKSLYK